MRRVDRSMSDERARQMLATGFCGRLATVGVDGWPYVVPFLYVWMDHQVFIHRTSSGGHLAENLKANPRVCFEIDAPDEVFAYGRYECDTGLAYASVIAFGSMHIVEDLEQKTRFCIELMRKYADAGWERPRGILPPSRRDRHLWDDHRSPHREATGPSWDIGALAGARPDEVPERQAAALQRDRALKAVPRAGRKYQLWRTRRS